MKKDKGIWVLIDQRGEKRAVSLISESDVVKIIIREYMPEWVFGKIELGEMYHGIVSDIWKSMERVGWKILFISNDDIETI